MTILDANRYVRAFGSLSDDQWRKFLIASIDTPEINGEMLPSFPSVQVQKRFTGRFNRDAVEVAFDIYTMLLRECVRNKKPIIRHSKVLDFGCGWGRFLRLFLRDVPTDNLFGADVDPAAIQICKDTNVPAQLSLISPTGTLPFGNDSFDLIFSYSVFSHLSEANHRHWIPEISRVLVKDGIVIISTRPRDLFTQYAAIDSGAFPDIAAAEKDYDEGKLVYSALGGGGVRDKSFFGEAAVPRQFFEKEWCRYLALRDFIVDRKRFVQNFVVMQKV